MNTLIIQIDNFISQYNEYVGGYLLLFLLIPTGIYFFIRLRFLNVRKLGYTFKILGGKYAGNEKGEIKPFRALTTALSGTVGTGNIVGVALAIYYGGPGAIFWMWITGFLGMVLKYSECMLAIKYRTIHKDGSVSGGPMYYIEKGLQSKYGRFAKILAVIFAIGAALCAFGTGNVVQAHSIADALHTNYNLPMWGTGIVLATLVLLVVIGGIKRIGKVTSKLVPIMAGLYIFTSLLIIFIHIDEVPRAFGLIFGSAFSGTSATGGFIGAAFIMTLRYGVARGIFSNESGQGSAAIAFAAAQSKYPVREGLVSSIGPFIDTIVVCSLTALVIIVSGAWESGIEGVAMTVQGFETGLNRIGIFNTGDHIVAIALILFAFSTMISWSYYGSKAVEYFFGEKSVKPYLYLYGFVIFLGTISNIQLVWGYVDMAVTFMTIPNLIGLLLLSPVIIKETKKYFAEFRT